MVNTECIEWTDGRYPRVVRNGVSFSIQRLMLSIGGDEPERSALEVRHLCGNPSCINREHILWSDHATNLADREVHGTVPRLHGTENGAAKLTEADVAVIRQRLDEGVSQRTIAAEFGVAQGRISDINIGKTWGHVA